MRNAEEAISVGLQRALDAAESKNWAAVERVRQELTNLSAQHPSAAAHYACGRVLLLLGQQGMSQGEPTDAAQAAFERALALDARHAPSRYSLGSLLAARGREADAMAHWEAAVAAAPGHVDALYNLGQAHYNRGEFASALARWSAARHQDPQDVEILKKVVQAHHALEQYAEAAQTLDALVQALRTNGAAGSLPTEIVIDQFRFGSLQVCAYKMLTPPDSDLDYVYTFKLFESPRQVLLSIQLESSAYSRECGVPYLLGMTRPTGHCLLGPSFSTLPPYAQLKPLVLAVLRAHASN